MRFILFGTAALLALTLLLAVLLRIALWLAGRKPTHYWRRTLILHVVLAVVHLFVTVPLAFGYVGSRLISTRPDERAYAGPRIDADGKWQLQSRASLAAEQRGEVTVPDALRDSQRRATVHLTAADGVDLRAFLVEPKGPVRCSVVLAHGLFRGGLELETPASMFRDLGAEVMLLELRNHGGSDRAPATFGRDEALDVVAAAAWLRARPDHEDSKLVLFGVSLGTVAVGLATHQIADIAAVVLDAPIDNLEETAHRMLTAGSRGHGRGLVIPQPFRSTLLAGVSWWSGFDFAAVRPGDALRQLAPGVSILLIGAGQDQRCPPTAVRALFDSLPTPSDHKTLWIVPNAGHGRVWTLDPTGYREHLEQLLQQVN